MITPTTDENGRKTEGREADLSVMQTPFEAWIGLLSGPVVFLFNVASSFSVLPWVAATSEYRAIYLSFGASVILLAISGWLAYRVWQQPAHSPQQQFAGFAGVLVSVFFIAAVSAVWIPHLGLGRHS
jgi:hypothetical protein